MPSNHFPTRFMNVPRTICLSKTLLLVVIFCQAVPGLYLGEDSFAADIQGRIFYRSLIPNSETIPITTDADTCGATKEKIPVRVDQAGGLQAVIISIVGHPLTDSPQTLEYLLSNTGCEFEPAIGTASVQQKVLVYNNDPILHNTHIRNSDRAFLNVVLLPNSKNVAKTFKQSGLLSIECNKHPFMTGSIYVFDHPFHTVSDQHGGFRISNLTPGTYSLRMFHEFLGSHETTLTIPPQGLSSLAIEFPPSTP